MHCNIIGKTQRDPAGLAAEPLPQLEMSERQMLQGILRLIAELRPQLNAGPVQVGSSGR
jgi:hypothetical protein